MPLIERRRLDRRRILAAAAGLTAGAGLAASPAQDRQATASEFEAALKKILGDAKPTEGKLRIDTPEIAENGNTVPYTVAVDSPMTEASYVKTLHVLAGGNPLPVIASFQLTPASGRAFVASRMRLARSQDVIAIAELSDGSFLLTRKAVKVTIGGCGG
jgi:sulfur-oxidizing protein SoxY